MPVINQDITAYRGGREVLNFTMTPVVDISSWTIEFTVARRTTKVRTNEITRLYTAATDKLISQVASITNGAAGTFQVVLTTAQMDLASDIYEYDVWRTDEDSELPLALGQFVVGGVALIPEPAGP